MQTNFNWGIINALNELVSLDIRELGAAAIQVTGTWVGTLTIQATVDQKNWFTVSGIDPVTLVPQSTFTANNEVVVPVAGYTWVRVKATAWTSGDAEISISASQAELGGLSVSGTGAGAGEVQGTSAAGATTTQGNPVRIGAKYKATPATRTDGQTSDLVTDVNENLKVTLATAISGENNPLDTTGVTQKPVISSSYSGTAFTNFGAASNANVTTVPTMLKSISAHNENAAVRYLQVFNLAAAPTEDTSVPLFSFTIPAGTAAAPGRCNVGAEFFGEAGYYLSAGLSWGISVDKDNWDSTGVTVTEHIVNGVRV